ncbi:hypothetical protein OAL45_00700 [bacterium]|nr:hypothetical protein [bacterium]MDC0317954.1 hypothetical protein [bacterium]
MAYLTTLPIEIELNNGDYKEFEVEFSASIENDSIGHYEYHGQKCFDKKPDYLGVIEDWDDFSLASEEEKHLLQNYIDLNEDSIIESMNDKWKDR